MCSQLLFQLLNKKGKLSQKLYRFLSLNEPNTLYGGQKKMEHLKAEGVESQNQLPQLEQPGKGTTFLKTCVNGVNTLSGLSLSLGEYAFYIE